MITCQEGLWIIILLSSASDQARSTGGKAEKLGCEHWIAESFTHSSISQWKWWASKLQDCRVTILQRCKAESRAEWHGPLVFWVTLWVRVFTALKSRWSTNANNATPGLVLTGLFTDACIRHCLHLESSANITKKGLSCSTSVVIF